MSDTKNVMCAINGFNFSNEDLIKKMLGCTEHRGPDQQGFWLNNDVSLGHSRLSIIDLSEKGKQPLWNEDKTKCIVFNGEIYNFQELRNGLLAKGHQFYSKSDTEVILHLYEEKQEKCVEDLNGIFAFAIYDINEKKLFLARDRVGVKPLYYYFDGHKFIFSSEIKGILVHPIKRKIDQEGLLRHFKLLFTPAPYTLFEGIKKLNQASYLVLKGDNLQIKKYWDLYDEKEISSVSQAVSMIQDLMQDSVRRQLVADRPVGIFLSGGIDSTSILGIASKFAAGKIKTYSVGFDIDVEQEKYNRDFWLAKKTADYYKTDHHELLISDLDVRDNLEKAVWHMEEPAPNPTQVPTFLLSKEAKKEVAVVLGGDGGDEIFGGYYRYYNSLLMDWYQKIPLIARKNIFSPLLGLVKNDKDFPEKLETAQGVQRYLLFMAQKTKILDEVFSDRFKNSLSSNATEEFLKRLYPENKFKDPTKYLMYLDLVVWLSDESLLRSDKMSMAWGLEQRVPILDHRLIELGFKIPTKFKVRGKKGNKWIFRQAMAGYLPSHIKNQDKRGWFAPASKWLRKGLKDFAFEALSENYNPNLKGMFDFVKVKKILESHISGEQYNLDIIWTLLMFQIWHRVFFEEKNV